MKVYTNEGCKPKNIRGFSEPEEPQGCNWPQLDANYVEHG